MQPTGQTTRFDELRAQFLLDPSVTFLNHGSFGACPRPVFETYQRWQLELERQPVEFLGRRHDALMGEARERLAQYVGSAADNVVFVSNASAGINLVARSLDLKPGDEILTTDHEYGAMTLTWQFVCERTGARYVETTIPLPVSSTEAFVEAFWNAITPRTRVIFLSHITSPTALIFPIKPITDRARAAGILTVIDGAHAPGQLSLDLQTLGADFYAGNCHKWLCAPKGAGFLHARPEHHRLLDPAVISWGWARDASLVGKAQYQGTRDIAAFLSVPAAIDFQAAHDWDTVRLRCHQLAADTRRRLTALTGLEPLQTSDDWFGQMVTLPLPPCDADALKRRLYDDYRIEVPIVVWRGKPHIRLSYQAYNTPSDTDRLLDALRALLPATAYRRDSTD